jgi:hypothetical protein
VIARAPPAPLAELLQRQLRLLGDLPRRSAAGRARRQRPLRASDFLLAVGDVHGDPDRARLVRHPALDGLRIHQVAYVENLKPRRQSNFSTARISPMIPSWIRSSSESPWPW